jgi:hypothetical protein
MERIYKYTLEIEDSQVLELPEGSKILSVMAQRDRVVAYALVDSAAKKTVGHIIKIVGTGQDFPDCREHFFLGTVSTRDGDLVWHVFEHVSLAIPLSNITDK